MLTKNGIKHHFSIRPGYRHEWRQWRQDLWEFAPLLFQTSDKGSVLKSGIDRGANMCDQDHFEKDRQEYEARGLVTRRQFGVLVGAGIAMMLPRGRQRGRGDRIGRDRDDAGRHRRLLLRAPGERHRSGRAGVAGHLRAAAGVPPDGQTARRIGLFGARGESVLSRQEGPDRGSRRARRRSPR